MICGYCEKPITDVDKATMRVIGHEKCFEGKTGYFSFIALERELPPVKITPPLT